MSFYLLSLFFFVFFFWKKKKKRKTVIRITLLLKARNKDEFPPCFVTFLLLFCPPVPLKRAILKESKFFLFREDRDKKKSDTDVSTERVSIFL